VSRRRIVVNFLAVAGTNVLGLLVTILISVYVRRAMGAEGDWPGQLGHGGRGVPHGVGKSRPPSCRPAPAQSPETSRSVIALMLSLQTLSASVVYAFVLVAAFLEPRGPVVSIVATLFVTAWNTDWALQAHERMVAAWRLWFSTSCSCPP
jgi:hypothetical protein